MANPFMLGVYDGTSPLEYSALSGSFSNATSTPLPVFGPPFDTLDGQSIPSLISGDETYAFFHPDGQRRVLECGGVDTDFFKLQGFDTSAYPSPDKEFRTSHQTAEIPWSEDSGFAAQLSLDLSYAPPLGVPYEHGPETSPSSSNGSLLEFSSYFDLKPDVLGLPSSVSLTSPPDENYVSIFGQENPTVLLPSPTAESPSHTWPLVKPTFDSERSYTHSMPHPTLPSVPCHRMQYAPATETAQWSSLSSESSLFTHAEAFTSRCVQPGRLLGEPLRSEWSGKGRKRSRSFSGCNTPSSPSTTDGSPIMVPHDPPQLLDSVVAKGPGGKYVCQCVSPGKSSPCGKSFDRGEHLKRHWVTHTGEKPFSCRLCGRKFSRNDNLNQHLKTHENFNGRNSKLLRAQKLHDQNDEPAKDVKPVLKKPRSRY